jgi:hypothetical protein
MMKKIKYITYFLSLLCSFSVQPVNANNIIVRLKSVQQKGYDCGFAALYCAYHMLHDNFEQEVKNQKNYDAFVKKCKQFLKSKKYETTNIDGKEIKACMDYFNYNDITIIERPEYLQNIIKKVNNMPEPETLRRARDNFATNNKPKPHAIIYNEGGHWVTFTIRRNHSNNKIEIFHTNSTQTSAQLSFTYKNALVIEAIRYWFEQPKTINDFQKEDQIAQILGRLENELGLNQNDHKNHKLVPNIQNLRNIIKVPTE